MEEVSEELPFHFGATATRVSGKAMLYRPSIDGASVDVQGG